MGGTPQLHCSGIWPGWGVPPAPHPGIWPGWVVLTPHPGIWPGWWVPPAHPPILGSDLDRGYHPPTWEGMPPHLDLGRGYPPAWTWKGYPPLPPVSQMVVPPPPAMVDKIKTLPSVILRMRAVKKWKYTKQLHFIPGTKKTFLCFRFINFNHKDHSSSVSFLFIFKWLCFQIKSNMMVYLFRPFHPDVWFSAIGVFSFCAVSFVVMEIFRIHFLRKDVQERLQPGAVTWRLFRVVFSQSISNSNILYKIFVMLTQLSHWSFFFLFSELYTLCFCTEQ